MKNFKQNLKLYIIFGVFYETAVILYNPFMAKFLDRLGGTAFDITLLNVVKGLVMALFTLPLVYYINKRNAKKKSIIKILSLKAVILLIISFINIFRFDASPHVFLFTVGLLFLPVSAYNPSFQDFTADTFPEKRADVIARRNMFTIMFTTITTVLVGLSFKHFSSVLDQITLYQLLYLISAILIICSIVIFNKFDYNVDITPAGVSIKNSFSYVISNKKYKKFLVSFTIFSFGWTMGWPLFSIYSIKVLGADELWVSLISVAGTLAMFFGHMIWPKIIAKIGESRVSFIATLGMSLTPILYSISTSLYTLVFISLITGFFTSGTITVLFAELLSVSPSENRFLFTAYYNICSNLTLAISPFIGQYIVSVHGIYMALYVTALFRLLGATSFFFRRKI